MILEKDYYDQEKAQFEDFLEGNTFLNQLEALDWSV